MLLPAAGTGLRPAVAFTEGAGGEGVSKSPWEPEGMSCRDLREDDSPSLTWNSGYFKKGSLYLPKATCILPMTVVFLVTYCPAPPLTNKDLQATVD